MYRLFYDHPRLKALLNSTGLSDEEVALRVKRKRLQVNRAMNGVSCSQVLLFDLVRVVNEELKSQQTRGKFVPIDARDLLLDPAHKPDITLAEAVS